MITRIINYNMLYITQDILRNDFKTSIKKEKKISIDF